MNRKPHSELCNTWRKWVFLVSANTNDSSVSVGFLLLIIKLWKTFKTYGSFSDLLCNSERSRTLQKNPNHTSACGAKIFPSPVSSVFRVSPQWVLPTLSLDVRDAHLENIIYLCRVGEDLAHYLILPSCCSPPLFHSGEERTVRLPSDLYCCLSWDQRIQRGK